MDRQHLLLKLKDKFNFKLQLEGQSQSDALKEVINKKQVRRYYQNKFNLRISHKLYLKLNEHKLHKYFLQKQKVFESNKTAVKIQKVYRGFISRK